jgi:hypothetical protein
MIENLQTCQKLEEPDYGLWCPECGFECYRGLPFDLARLVALGHLYITHHALDIYEIQPERVRGHHNQHE